MMPARFKALRQAFVFTYLIGLPSYVKTRLPVIIYAALALREQGKRALFRLAAGTCVFIIVSMAVIRYLDGKLMGTGIWF
jgi:hypothetical protein